MKNIRKWIMLICLMLSFAAVQAQISEDFSDGDFNNNPVWIGTTDSFSVSSGQLRTTAGNSNTGQSLYLFSVSSQTFFSWEFYFRLAFNPSSQNYAEFWLTSDNPNLNLAENGYFVRIGGNTGDGIGLFKMENGSESVLIDPAGNSLVNGSSNNFGYIRVSRTQAGNWSIAEKITSADFLPFGSASDNSLSGSLGIGIRIQTTKTNRTKHYFDDIRADLLPGNDSIAPNLNSLTVIPPRQLELLFSEDLDSAFASAISQYSLIPAQTIDSARRLSSDRRKVLLSLNDTIQLGSNTIQVFSSKDIAGNIQADTQSLSFNYNPPQPAPWRSIQINEIYADETPSLGLPEGEFLELYNAGSNPVSLAGWSISDAGSPVFLPSYILPPGAYLILCSNADTTAFKLLGPTRGISLPSLNNTGDFLSLRDAFGNLVDAVNYTDDWYQDPSKAGGGYSLEQINPLLRCSDKNNWIASNAGIGGTAGQANSVNNPQQDIQAPALDSLIVEGPEALRLAFSEAVSEALISNSSFTLSGGMNVASFTFLDPSRIRLNLASPLTIGVSYSLSCSGIRDCEGNIATNLSREFSYQPPQPLSYRQLQINEIYADENPSLGLPGKEYLEIHNHGSSTLQLEGVRVRVGNTQVILPAHLMPAGGYLTLCDSDSLSRFLQYGPALGINLPALNNSGAEIRLLDFLDNETDKVVYSPDWYDDPSKKEGGYSLEQVNPGLICSSKSNWRASVEGIGGTPGQENSVLSSQPDIQAPSLISAERTSANSLKLLFSEVLNENSILQADVEISGGLQLAQLLYRNPDNESISLVFSSDFQPGKLYSLKIRNLKDCAGNVLGLLEIPVGIGRSPKRFELLITEVQADDTPENSLPEAEFVEIFNKSDALLDLAGLKFSDGSSNASLPSRLLAPGAYLVLCGSSSAAKFTARGIAAQGITSFPSINLEGDNLSLITADGNLLHRFFFRSSQFSPYSLWEKGWSLEMIDTSNPCSESGNWAISTAPEGGTPGKENSVTADKPDLTAPRLLRLSIPDSSRIRLLFDEQLDSLSLSSMSISLSGGFSILGREINPAEYAGLNLLLNKSIPLNTPVEVRISGAADCAGNIGGSESKSVARANMPETGDWLLSEILFDPLTGGSDYLEIRNVSAGYLDLKDIRIGNAAELKDPLTESYLVEPGGFIIFTESTSLTLRDFPRGRKENFIEMSLPSFNIDSGTARITSLSGRELERFSYSQDLHAPVLDETKGVSLERISSALPAGSPDSWQSASADAGFGTPGYENSNDRDFDLSGNFKADPKVFAPFGGGPADFTMLSYELTETGLFANLRIYSASGTLVKELARSQNLGSKGFWKWDGRDENGRTAGIGLYLAVLELNRQGEGTRYLRIPLAITAAR
jgi:hypothetical protein